METSKIVTYELWYDYVKKRYGEKAKLCYMDTSSFIVHIKIADFVKDVEKKLDTSNYELDHFLKKILNHDKQSVTDALDTTSKKVI